MAVQSAQVTAKSRSELGSRANKRLRDAGLLPGVIYGHKEAVIPVTLPKKEVVNHLDHGARLFDLSLDGKSEKVLIKEVQYDHLGMEVLHVDFARVSLDEKVKVSVPVELKGIPKGAAEGGVLHQVISAVDVECLVTEIPDVIRHNIVEMALNDVLHIKDLKAPEGVKILQDKELIVATVREILEEADAVVAPAEGESTEPELIRKPVAEGEEGAEAPAAGAAGKAPAGKAPAGKAPDAKK
jgi:large subunit ribosomal protein L25